MTNICFATVDSPDCHLADCAIKNPQRIMHHLRGKEQMEYVTVKIPTLSAWEL